MSDLGKPLTQFIVEQQQMAPQSSVDLSGLLNDVVRACKKISYLVAENNVLGLGGYAGSDNVQGEAQKKLDILTHDVMVNALSWTGHLAAMASEEVEEIIPIPDQYPKGQYLICFDPLDGSSNSDINLSVGSIFSILRCPPDCQNPTPQDFMQSGTEQICAGFTVYGPATILVLTTGNGVNGFTLDEKIGEFVLTHPTMRIPEETAEFAINMSNQRFWQPPVQRYITECLAGAEGARGKDFNMRWVASMVAEVFRVLTRGGVFMYPLDNKIAPQCGKLRLMYEANPMSFIVEQAGGLSSTGQRRIMEIVPTEIHQRVPVILGSKNEVERLITYHQS